MPRVLVAEDNASMAKVIVFKLQSVGLEVTVAGNGALAWAALQQEAFDFAIVDYMMPEMNGSELISRIRQDPSCSGMPIILVTAKFLEIDVACFMREHNLVGVFAKPFSPAKLARTVLENLPTPSFN